MVVVGVGVGVAPGWWLAGEVAVEVVVLWSPVVSGPPGRAWP